MDLESLRGPLNPFLAYQDFMYKVAFRRAHPDYFDPSGLMILYNVLKMHGAVETRICHILNL